MLAGLLAFQKKLELFYDFSGFKMLAINFKKDTCQLDIPKGCYAGVLAQGKLKTSFLKSINPNPKTPFTVLSCNYLPSQQQTYLHPSANGYPFLHVMLLKCYLQEQAERKLLQRACCRGKTGSWHLSEVAGP